MEIIRFIFSFTTGWILIGAIPRLLHIIESAPKFVGINQIIDYVSLSLWILSLSFLVVSSYIKVNKWK
jgi:hypothetical protein